MADLKTCIITSVNVITKTLENGMLEKKRGEMTIVIYN